MEIIGLSSSGWSSPLSCYLILQQLALFNPEFGRGIAGHTPVATGTEADAAHLRTIGQARALELLGKGATAEYGEPVLDDLVAVRAHKGMLSQKI